MELRKPNRSANTSQPGFALAPAEKASVKVKILNRGGRQESRQIYLMPETRYFRGGKGLCVQIRRTTKWSYPGSNCSQYPRGSQNTYWLQPVR